MLGTYAVIALLIGTLLTAQAALALASGNHRVNDNFHGHSVQAWNVAGGRESVHGFTVHESGVPDWMHASVDYRSSTSSICADTRTTDHAHCNATEEITFVMSHHFGVHISNHLMD